MVCAVVLPAAAARRRREVRTDDPSAALEHRAVLADHFLFRDLGPEILERLNSYAKLRTVERGTTIFQKGDAGSSLFAVCRGTVQVTTLSTAGKNAVFNLFREGEIFGEIALLDGKPRTTDAVAFTDCTLMVIERRDFLPLLRSHPDMTIKLIEVLCARLRRTTEQVEDLLFLDLSSRLAKALLHLSQAAPNREITISQDDLSHIVGLSREMINKQLQVWAKDGWISLARKRITVLQPEALGRIVGE
jgi:CRP/FNR family cyclic AMP-dependent transcriptional regulator